MGDSSASLSFDAVYAELRALASAKLGAAGGRGSLEPTAVVHEVWLKLVEGPASLRERDRSHFFATAAQAMRWLLVDRARRRRSRSIASVFDQPIDEAVASPDGAGASIDDRILDLDAALVRLERAYPRPASVVVHRYFAGLSVDETAEAMQLSPATVKREWAFARAWLVEEMGSPGKEPES